MIKHSGSGGEWSGQFLVSTHYKYMYCDIGKVASSSLKAALTEIGVSQIYGKGGKNIRPPELPKDGKIHLKKTLLLGGITGLGEYSIDSIRQQLNNYTKFMFVRHPIERVISAYRDKLETEADTYFVRHYGKQIVLKYGKGKHGMIRRLKPTFSEFVQFLLTEKPWNPHWNTYHSVCIPCFIEYDYIGKLEDMHEDTEHIFNIIFGEATSQKAIEAFPKRNSSKKSGKYVNASQKYLSQLTCEQLEGLHEMFAQDLALYEYKVIGMDVCIRSTKDDQKNK